jgi:hypothetical protein
MSAVRPPAGRAVRCTTSWTALPTTTSPGFRVIPAQHPLVGQVLLVQWDGHAQPPHLPSQTGGDPELAASASRHPPADTPKPRRPPARIRPQSSNSNGTYNHVKRVQRTLLARRRDSDTGAAGTMPCPNGDREGCLRLACAVDPFVVDQVRRASSSWAKY